MTAAGTVPEPRQPLSPSSVETVPATLGPWTTSVEVDEIAPALVAALGSMEDVARGSTADAGSYSYRYADLASVLTAVRPILAANGLVLAQAPVTTGSGVEVAPVILHSSGQWIAPPPLRLPTGSTAQQIGSAITYARRYSILPLLGLAAGDDDDDGAAASRSSEPVPRDLLPVGTMERFRSGAMREGLDAADVIEIVRTATKGRTVDLEAVYFDEIDALNEAFKNYVRNNLETPAESGVSRGQSDEERSEGE